MEIKKIPKDFDLSIEISSVEARQLLSFLRNPENHHKMPQVYIRFRHLLKKITEEENSLE